MSISRQQRRAAEREAREYLHKWGIPPTRDITPLFIRTRELIGVLSNVRNSKRATDAVEIALKGFDLSANSHPPEMPVACRKGCAFCCYGWVAASAPEVFRIAQFIKQGPPEEVERSMQRIERANRATIGRDENLRLKDRQPCAFLVESACTAYAERPLVCRGMASNAVAACESAFADGIAEGRWIPRYETFPINESPLPEFSKDR
jgi:hypothetical protein